MTTQTRDKIAMAMAGKPPQSMGSTGGDAGEPPDDGQSDPQEGDELQQKLTGLDPQTLVAILVQLGGMAPQLMEIIEQMADQSGAGQLPAPQGQPAPQPVA